MPRIGGNTCIDCGRMYAMKGGLCGYCKGILPIDCLNPSCNSQYFIRTSGYCYRCDDSFPTKYENFSYSGKKITNDSEIKEEQIEEEPFTDIVINLDDDENYLSDPAKKITSDCLSDPDKKITSDSEIEYEFEKKQPDEQEPLTKIINLDNDENYFSDSDKEFINDSEIEYESENEPLTQVVNLDEPVMMTRFRKRSLEANDKNTIKKKKRRIIYEDEEDHDTEITNSILNVFLSLSFTEIRDIIALKNLNNTLI